jgi:hypothetical protein
MSRPAVHYFHAHVVNVLLTLNRPWFGYIHLLVKVWPWKGLDHRTRFIYGDLRYPTHSFTAGPIELTVAWNKPREEDGV